MNNKNIRKDENEMKSILYRTFMSEFIENEHNEK